MNFVDILKFITARSNVLPNNVRGAYQLSPEESLNIYRSDYLARLQSVLSIHFPMTWKVLGDDQFFTAARAYVLQTTSGSWDINTYGDHFPQFLAENSKRLFRVELPFIFDLATLEWASHEFFHEAPFASPLQTRPQSEEALVRLRLSPTLTIFSSAYQIPELYRAAQRGDDQTPSNWHAPSFYFLSKKDFIVQLEDLNEHQFRILTIWKKEGTFEKTIETLEASLIENDPTIVEIGPLIERMFNLGFLVH